MSEGIRHNKPDVTATYYDCRQKAPHTYYNPAYGIGHVCNAKCQGKEYKTVCIW